MESIKLKRSKQRLKRGDIKRINIKSLSENEKRSIESSPSITLKANSEELFQHLLSEQAGLCFFCGDEIDKSSIRQIVIEFSLYIEKKYLPNCPKALCERCCEVGVIASALNYDSLISYIAKRLKLRGKGQQSLADGMGINQATVSRIKNKKVDSISPKVSESIHKAFATEYQEHNKNKQDIYTKFKQRMTKSGYLIIKENHAVLNKSNELKKHMLTCDLGIFNSKNQLTAICFLKSTPLSKGYEVEKYIDLLESFRAKYLIFFSKDESIYYELKNLMGQYKAKDKLLKVKSLPPLNLDTKKATEAPPSSHILKPTFQRGFR